MTFKPSMQETLWGNLYDNYKRKELPVGVIDIVAIRKADAAFTDILGDEDELWFSLFNFRLNVYVSSCRRC